MRILIYTANYAPEPTGTGKYSGEMAAWLAAQGHDVRVVAAPPYYPNWKLGAGYAWPPYRRERLEAVLARRTRWLTVALEDIYQPHNAAAVLRSCDGFGVPGTTGQ